MIHRMFPGRVRMVIEENIWPFWRKLETMIVVGERVLPSCGKYVVHVVEKWPCCETVRFLSVENHL